MRSRLLQFLTVILLSFLGLSGCSVNESTTTAASPGIAPLNEKPVTIAASFYPVYIFSLNIAKDIPNVQVVNMTKPITGCLHDYILTPEDLKILETAKFFVINGAGMESFMDKVVSQMPQLKIIDSSTGLTLIPGQGDEAENPHVWLSITNAIVQVQNIGGQLAALDPENAAAYQKNTAVYVQKLETERTKMHQALKDLPHRDIITFHEAFPYFAQEFGLNIAGVVEREPGSEPSAKELSQTIDQINQLNVKALFVEPQYSTKSAETLARQTGAKVYTLDPIVTGPLDADAYIQIMDNNCRVLQEALQ